MTQRTLVMLRKDGIPHRDAILQRLQAVANIVASRKYFELPRGIAEELYAEHKEKDFFPWLVDYHAKQPAEFYILEAKNEFVDLYASIDMIVGPTDPTDARNRAKKLGTDSIRSWSLDSMETAREQNRMVANIIHRSKTLDDALREAKIAFGQELYDIASSS